MIVDTSALVAVFYREPEAAVFARIIHDAQVCRMSVASCVELYSALERRLQVRYQVA